jgi:uncharacterized Tic20 family protein
MTEFDIPSESDERTMALLIYLSSFVAALFGPLIIWMIKKDESELVDYHGREALNLWLTTVIASVASMIIGIATLGFGFFVTIPVLILWSLAMLIFTIIAAIKAFDGKAYRIPMILRLL